MIDYVDTQAAADQLGVTRRRVQAMIKSGRLPATKLGRDWLINPADLAGLKHRPPGRPKKDAEEPASPKRSRGRPRKAK